MFLQKRQMLVNFGKGKGNSQTTPTSACFFNTPESLALLDIKTLVTRSAHQSILIVAPHPDDETLGCGGAIALLRQLNVSVKVLIVSDGTKSHPNSLTYPPPALKELRERESLAALAILGVASEAVTFLGMPDGAVPIVETDAVTGGHGDEKSDKIEEYQQAMQRGLGEGLSPVVSQAFKSPVGLPHERYPKVSAKAYAKRYPKGLASRRPLGLHQEAIALIYQHLTYLAPSIIFLPWRRDPHPDHRASRQLFTAAIKNLATSPRMIEYPIWDWDSQQRGDFADSINAWRLDISSVLELKRQAIAQYRSQISDLIKDDPQGFRLTPQMLQNFTQPWEIYLEVKS